jgi:bile acid acyltransferase/acyl-CoA thioester hydrolase-like protein
MQQGSIPAQATTSPVLGWRPTTTDNTDPIQDGGTPEADAHAQTESWTQMLDFLNRELHP